MAHSGPFGWRNAKTWTIADYVDNDEKRLKRCLDIINFTPLPRVLQHIKEYLRLGDFKSAHPWVWEPGAEIDDPDIAWEELLQHWCDIIRKSKKKKK